MKNRNGFTLIELLVVVAIIGVLATVVVSSMNAARVKSRNAARVAAVKQLQSAIEIFRTTNGRYPGGDETGSDFLSLAPTYINAIPVGPQGEIFQYQGLVNPTTGGACGIGGSCESYHLGVTLEPPANSGVLLVDKDAENVAGPTNGTTFDGLSTQPNCAADTGVTQATDLCYDITP